MKSQLNSRRIGDYDNAVLRSEIFSILEVYFDLDRAKQRAIYEDLIKLGFIREQIKKTYGGAIFAGLISFGAGAFLYGADEHYVCTTFNV